MEYVDGGVARSVVVAVVAAVVAIIVALAIVIVDDTVVGYWPLWINFKL